MPHRAIRDRVEDELFERLGTGAPKEESEDVAQSERTRKIVEATKGLLMEDASLTTRELHARLSRDGASLPKPASFAVYATQARKELGIDGRRAVASTGDPEATPEASGVSEPQGDSSAGESEAGAEDDAPAPPADGGLEIPDQDSPTVAAAPAARSTSTYERRRRTEGGNVEYMRLGNGEVLVKASGPLEWVKTMVAALPEEDGER